MKLRQAVIGVHHHDCWGSLSLQSLPEISMLEKGPVLVEKCPKGVSIRATWDVSYPDKEIFYSYLKTLREKYNVKRIRIITQTPNHALINTMWRGVSSSYDVVFRHDYLYVSPVMQKEGYEIYTIVSERSREIGKLLNELEQIGEVKVFRIGDIHKERNPFMLTEKQLRSLQIALNHDYYTWPRKATLQDLAEIAKMKRRTFQENLRKAEAKVFPNLAKKALSDRDID